jgi:hypothetical protein
MSIHIKAALLTAAILGSFATAVFLFVAFPLAGMYVLFGIGASVLIGVIYFGILTEMGG